MASIFLLRNINNGFSCKKVTCLNINSSLFHFGQLYKNHPANFKISPIRQLANTSDKNNNQNTATLTSRQKLKKAVAEYGSTVIVFHVGISLISLGTCYVLVSSGLDVNYIITKSGISGEIANKIATGAGTFAVAYAVHKVFAPVRIMITLTATPFIVKYLRNIGWLRKSS